MNTGPDINSDGAEKAMEPLGEQHFQISCAVLFKDKFQ